MMDRCSMVFVLLVLLAFQTIYGIGCDDCTLKCGSDAACWRQCPPCDDSKRQARKLEEVTGPEEELEDLFDNVDIDELMTDLSGGPAAEFDDDFDPDLGSDEEVLPPLTGIPTEPLIDPLTGLPMAAQPLLDSQPSIPTEPLIDPLTGLPMAAQPLLDSQPSIGLDLGFDEEPIEEETVTSEVPVVAGETIVTEPSLLDPATPGTPIVPPFTAGLPADTTETLGLQSEATLATEPGLLDATGPMGSMPVEPVITAAEPGTDFEPIGTFGEPGTTVEPALGMEGGVGVETSLFEEIDTVEATPAVTPTLATEGLAGEPVGTAAPLLAITAAPVVLSASATPNPAPVDSVPTANEGLPGWASPGHEDQPSLDDPLKGTTPEEHDNIGRNGQHGIAFSAVLMAAVVFALIYFTFCRRPRRRDGMREMEMSTWVNGDDDNGIL